MEGFGSLGDWVGLAFVLLSLGTFVIWILTHITWMRWLGRANGTRPFIRSTLIISYTMLVFSAMMTAISVYSRPNGPVQFVTAVGYRGVALIVCWVVWRLYAALHELGHSGESDRPAANHTGAEG